VDLDMLIKRDDQTRWLSALESAGYRKFHDGGSFVQLSPPAEGWWPVDMMLVAEPTFSGMWEASRELEGQPTKPRIPSVEHLLALKLHALKHTRIHRFLKDFQDVVGVIEAQKLDLSSEKMKRLFEKYGTMELYEKVARALA